MGWPFGKTYRETVESSVRSAPVLTESRAPVVTADRRPSRPVQHRNYAAARSDRLTSTWLGTGASIDALLRGQLVRLRHRSRQLCRDNDYAKKFLQMCETNVVGPTGPSLQIKVVSTRSKGAVVDDTMASKAIENAFYKWAKRGNCDITGKHSFVDICRLYVRSLARDGEVLLRKIYGEGEFGFKLQVIAIDRLDVDHNAALGNGHIVRMGVEVDRYGRPVAYYILTRHPGDDGYSEKVTRKHERVPAEDIYHHFVADEAEQTRGVPWMYAAMLRLNNLGGYEEAAIIAARVGAAKMGFFVSETGDTTELASEETETGDLITEAEAGVFDVLPEGMSFEKFDPEYPHAMYDKFVKATLRGVASGMGVSYNGLANDLEGVNFSSIRQGVLEEREGWMAIQTFMIESFLDDLFSTWLYWSLLKGAVKQADGSALPAAKFEKFNAGTWQGRRWQWVDPVKDMQANVLAIANNLKSRSDVIAEQGRDPAEVFAQLASEKQQLDALGLSPVADDAAAQKENPKKEKDSEDE